jgi:hypothetical protein
MLKTTTTFILLFLSINISFSQELSNNSARSKNAILITPLMGLIEDTKSSIYYKRFLINNTSRYFNFRAGTEILSSVKHTYSTGRKEQFRAFNWKAGIEYGLRFNRSTFYFGGEIGNSRYKMNGAIMYPNQNALFNNNSIIIEESRSVRDASTLNIISAIGFLGFKYQIVDCFNIGIESGIGQGRYTAELIYDEPLFNIRSENYNGKLTQFTPNRFIFIEYIF